MSYMPLGCSNPNRLPYPAAIMTIANCPLLIAVYPNCVYLCYVWLVRLSNDYLLSSEWRGWEEGGWGWTEDAY